MLSQNVMDSLRQTAQEYHRQLSDTALQYLDSRGLYGELGAVADSYLLGSVEDPAPGHEGFVGRISIPYITPSGVVQIKFRDITGDSKVKYMGLDGYPSRLYNVQALHDAGSIIFVAEGELDAISATEAGYPCVGVPGVNNWQPHYARCLEDFERVIILADGDEAGKKYASELRKLLENATVAWLPNGSDVNELLTRNDGQQQLADLIGM